MIFDNRKVSFSFCIYFIFEKFTLEESVEASFSSFQKRNCEVEFFLRRSENSKRQAEFDAILTFVLLIMLGS